MHTLHKIALLAAGTLGMGGIPLASDIANRKALPKDHHRHRSMEREGDRVTAIDGTVYTTRWDGRLERGDYQTGARRIRKQRKQAAFGIKPLTHRATQGAHGWGAPLFR